MFHTFLNTLLSMSASWMSSLEYIPVQSEIRWPNTTTEGVLTALYSISVSLDIKQTGLPLGKSETLTLSLHTLTQQAWLSTGSMTRWKTWEAGLPQQRIIMPWQRAYFEKHIISGIMSSLPAQWRWHRRRPTRQCRGGRTGRTVDGKLKLEGGRRGKTEQKGKRSGCRPLTSLVLQMSPSVAPQAFPGVAFQGIIPTGSERWNITGLPLSHLRQEAFFPPPRLYDWKLYELG